MSVNINLFCYCSCLDALLWINAYVTWEIDNDWTWTVATCDALFTVFKRRVSQKCILLNTIFTVICTIKCFFQRKNLHCYIDITSYHHRHQRNHGEDVDDHDRHSSITQPSSQKACFVFPSLIHYYAIRLYKIDQAFLKSVWLAKMVIVKIQHKSILPIR